MKDETPVGRLGYQPAFDGFRAVGVVLVILFHYGGFPPAGAFGVDLFFVLSGFLITTILLEEYSTYGRISLRRFYLRRALRLFPALWVMLAVCAIVLPWSPESVGAGALHIGEGLTYTMDITLATHDEPSSFMLLHLWSLGVEEQFYLLWPLVLVLFLGRGRLRYAFVVAAGAALCIVLARFAFARGPGPEGPAAWATRFDPILVGCSLALCRVSRFGAQLTKVASSTPATLVAGGVCVGLALVPNTRAITDGAGFAFALAAGVLIVGSVADGGSVFRVGLNRLLATSAFVFVGRISYALYLWHLPVLVFFVQSSFYDSLGRLPVRILALALTTAAAIASYYLVEQRFLRMKWRLARVSTHDVDISPHHDVAIARRLDADTL